MSQFKFHQEAQLMPTNPRDAFRGHSRPPNMVPFDKRRFQSKIANVSHPCVFNPSPLKGFPLELGNDARGQKPRMMCYQMVKTVLI